MYEFETDEVMAGTQYQPGTPPGMAPRMVERTRPKPAWRMFVDGWRQRSHATFEVRLVVNGWERALTLACWPFTIMIGVRKSWSPRAWWRLHRYG